MSITFTETFKLEHCCNCGISFGVTMDFQKRRINDKQSFYCPFGHGQSYAGISEAQKVANAEQDKRNALIAKDKAEREAASLRTFFKNGVCPWCKRSFMNMKQHMKSKHSKP